MPPLNQGKPRPSVFLSYAGDDLEWKDSFFSAAWWAPLTDIAEKYDYAIDPQRVGNLNDEMAQRIENCSMFVVILSSFYINKDGVVPLEFERGVQRCAQDPANMFAAVLIDDDAKRWWRDKAHSIFNDYPWLSEQTYFYAVENGKRADIEKNKPMHAFAIRDYAKTLAKKVTAAYKKIAADNLAPPADPAQTEIFISYAREDDAVRAGGPDKKGFVTFLEEQIGFRFRNGATRPAIWRDRERLSEEAPLSAETEKALKNASVLVVVQSQDWMSSAWCGKEFEAFARHHPGDGLQDRIITIRKSPVSGGALPLFQSEAEFFFYDRDDPSVGGFFELRAAGDKRIWDRLHEVTERLLHLMEGPTPPPPPPLPLLASGRAIYVAKPASDMRAEYDRVVKELTGKGHTVVPDPAKEIPLDSSATAVIDAALENAEIAVHLLGAKEGPSPEDQPTIVRLQLARAAAKAAGNGAAKFHRLIWAPKIWNPASGPAQGTGAPAQDAARQPLDVVAKLDRQLPTDKIEGDNLSKFVDFLNQHLVIIAPPPPPLDTSRLPGNARIYLSHSAEDTEYAFDLSDALRQRRWETIFPAFEGSEADIRRYHGRTLAECDAVVLCWASASEVWVRAQASELSDWQRLGRKQRFSYRAVITAPPPGARKKFGKKLFPESEIDLVVDLSGTGSPTSELLDLLVPAPRAHGP